MLKSRLTAPIIHLVLILLMILCVFANAYPVSAHPADMYYQVLKLSLSRDAIQLDWEFYPGILLASVVWQEADSNFDGEVTTSEAQAWAEGFVPLVYAEIDTGTTLDWQFDSIRWPDSFESLELGDQAIEMSLTAPIPEAEVSSRPFLLHNQCMEDLSIHWFSIEGSGSVRIDRPQQQRGRIQFNLFAPPEPEQVQVEGLLDSWNSGTPKLGFVNRLLPETDAMEGEVTAPPSDPEIGPRSSLLDLIRVSTLTPQAMIVILVAALLLGGVHALTPGHGKALVAAYLVGAQGTPRHATILGLMVTLTHTGSVLMIGFLALAVSRYLLPSMIYPLLSLVSGFLVILVGFVVFRRGLIGLRSVLRSRDYRFGKQAVRGYSKRIEIKEPVTTRVYDALFAGDSDSSMILSWRSLISLGFGAGIVPCPDSIALLLMAVAVNRIPLGISIILIFSFGMAFILVVLGIAVVRGRGLLARLIPGQNLSIYLPMLSGLVVIVLGVVVSSGALQYTNKREATPSLENVSGPPAEEVASLETETPVRPPENQVFSLESASVLYLGRNTEGRDQLHLLELPDGDGIQITFNSGSVSEYVVSPEANAVVYYIIYPSSAGELHRFDFETREDSLLLRCPGPYCGGLAWSPDGERIIFQWTDVSDDSGTGFGSLRSLDPVTGEKEPLFQDSQLPSFSASWSPDGEWLSFYTPGVTTNLQIYNLRDGSSWTFPTQLAAPVTWSPDSSALLMQGLHETGADITTHLILLDVRRGEVIDLNQGGGAHSGFAAWSPDGSLIADVRRSADDSAAARGNELWIIRPDGTQVKRLSGGENVVYSHLAWSPDSRYLLYSRLPLEGSFPDSSIWMVNVESGEPWPLAEPATHPSWISP
jgi:ABC-type nickel/cobalt efflux system permease component RcnA